MADHPPPFDELPELTRSLRSLGSRRRASGQAEAASEDQERYFAPLLDARRRAAEARGPALVAAAFDARRILARVDATLRAFATERFGARPAARRAFEAELFELAEPFREALQLLGERARELEPDAAGLPPAAQWSAWVAQLQVTFRVADDGWPPVQSALDAAPPAGHGLARRPRSSGPGGTP
jgi:hypothetical protein